jgi:proline iminopeptidase
MHQSSIADTGSIDIGPFQLRYRIEGTGVPILVIGSSLYYPPTFSPQLRKHLQFIFVDHKIFVIPISAVDNTEYELNVLVDDVERIRQALNLKRMIVLGHSGNSYIALEYAKKYPQHVSHVVMLGISPNLNPAGKTTAEQYWQDSVCPERKAAMERNMLECSDEKLAQLPADQRFIQRYLRDTPRIWYNFDFAEAKKLWEGVQFNMQMFDYVWGIIFRDIDITQGLDQFDKPVFLGLGRYDFLVAPPSAWDAVRSKFKDLTIRIFEKSGHTPQLEEPELFNRELLQWLSSRQT